MHPAYIIAVKWTNNQAAQVQLLNDIVAIARMDLFNPNMLLAFLPIVECIDCAKTLYDQIGFQELGILVKSEEEIELIPPHQFVSENNITALYSGKTNEKYVEKLAYNNIDSLVSSLIHGTENGVVCIVDNNFYELIKNQCYGHQEYSTVIIADFEDPSENAPNHFEEQPHEGLDNDKERFFDEVHVNCLKSIKADLVEERVLGLEESVKTIQNTDELISSICDSADTLIEASLPSVVETITSFDIDCF